MNKSTLMTARALLERVDVCQNEYVAVDLRLDEFACLAKKPALSETQRCDAQELARQC